MGQFSVASKEQGVIKILFSKNLNMRDLAYI